MRCYMCGGTILVAWCTGCGGFFPLLKKALEEKGTRVVKAPWLRAEKEAGR